ncbi:MAG TPA: CHAT domain-containing protein [candidate division Zixibacteria bacterium]|nr:CHAT domain-containing protein [candidate division Zixibacteria bacterium]
MNALARTFLRTGQADPAQYEQLAETCNDLVRSLAQTSTRKAEKTACRFVEVSKPIGGVMHSSALRALGWACSVGGKYEASLENYLAARKMLRNAPVMQARIDRILIDVYMYLGQYAQARRRAHLAIERFKKEGLRADQAKTEVNLGNLLHRQDRHSEARRYYQQATDYFVEAGNDLAAAICRYNLANTQVQLFEFEQAEENYRRAEECFSKAGYELYAVDCRNGMAWLQMLRGNYHVALRELNACQEGYRKVSQPRGLVLCLLDKAEAYLGLNLLPDARRAAMDAARRAHTLKIDYEYAKAKFFAAKAAFAMGHAGEARRHLQPALKLFAGNENHGFLASAQLLEAQLDGRLHKGLVQKAWAGFDRAQLPLWKAICDLHLLQNKTANDKLLHRLAANPAVKSVPYLSACRHTLLGDHLAGRGRMKQAVEHWTAAADILDSVRAKLPPLDLRSSFMKDRTDPYLRLVDAEAKERPQHAAAWSERYMTAGLWTAIDETHHDNPARRRAEESLVALAGQVTALAGRVDGAMGQRQAPASMNHGGFIALQRKVRENLAALEHQTAATLDPMKEIIGRMQTTSIGRTIIQMHRLGDDLIACVHHNGVSRVHRYERGHQTIDKLLGQWRFLISRQLFNGTAESTRDIADEQTYLERAGAWLLEPLDLPGSGKLLLIPEGRLTNLPWQALMIDGKHLVDRYTLTLAPSLRHFQHARQLRINSPKQVVMIGRTDGLKYVDQELAGLPSKNEDTEWLSPCHRAAVPDRSSARLWHYTGHASLRSDNPFYSALELEDGPMFAADFRLRHNRVGLVMLAGCRTGQQSSLPGEESSGLVRSMLEMGARNVIASHWAVVDQSAALWMNRFYEYYNAGRSASTAARRSAIDVREQYRMACHWAAFSVFGAG